MLGSGGTMGGGSMGGMNPALQDETLDGTMDGIMQDEMNQLDENGDPVNGDDSTGGDGDGPGADGDGGDGAEDGLADETGDQQADETQQQDETQNDEGSGGDDGFFGGFPSFSFPSFFRSFSTGGGVGGYRQGRQLYSPCVDRITLPCIVEDFIGAGMGDVPSCIPIHCGNSLCHSGVSSCKIETSVTPFYLGVHFGDGKRNKGSPEDNIGACLRYKQLPCS